MGIRETLNKNPILPSVLGVLVIAAAVYVIYWTATDKGLTAEMPTQHYYTVDDGKTLFAMPANTVAPFEKDGKPAVRAHVFTCDKGKTQFIAYLSKYTDEFAKRAAAELAKPEAQNQQPGMGIHESAAASTSLLLRKPGEAQWLSAISDQGQRVMSIRCPSNDPWDLVELHPKK